MTTISGNQVNSAKEDAAIYAISRLLDINLKTYTPPSKVKLVCDIMPKIRLDKVMSRNYDEMYQMSVKVRIKRASVRFKSLICCFYYSFP